MIAYNINWDIDLEDQSYVEFNPLPTEVTIPNDITVDEACDYLSDTYGFCVRSFDLCDDEDDYKHNYDIYMKNLKVEYNKYRLNWMIDHGYSLDDIIEGLQSVFNSRLVEDGIPQMKDLFNEWETYQGFNGSLYASFDEWCENERKSYIRDGVTKKPSYEEYQLQWMIDHGYSLNNLMTELTQLQYDDPDDKERISTPISDLYNEWEQDVGFGSEIWACEAEWEDCENE